MFSGFQSNSFQSPGFQIVRGGVVPPTPALETKGGIDERDYHRYRRHLERLMEVTQEAEQRKYIRTVAKDAKALTDLPIDTTELQKITAGPQLKGKLKLTPDIDYELLSNEIMLIQQYLINHIRQIEFLREQDDEAAFLLLLQ
jgi:hypothetical protein